MIAKKAREVWILGACLMLAGVLWVPSHLTAEEEGAPPTEFFKCWMVFLERGDHPPQLDEEASAELQRKHLAHLTKVWKEGYALVSGPFEVPAEEPLRGISLYRGDLDRERVLELANADPAVQAGRLKVRAVKWWTPAGILKFESPSEEN